jgi:hypothetical protein
MSDDSWSKRTAVHNQLSDKFINEFIRPILLAGGDYGDLLVLLETAMLQVLLINREHFNMDPAKAVTLLEECMGQAIERFVEKR